MKTIWILLFAISLATVSCSSRIPRENPDGTPTTPSDMDGTYTLSYQPGIKENFQFSISASCGSIKESLNKDLIKNSTPVDFWIK